MEELICLVLFVGICFGALMGGVYGAGAWDCNSFGEITGKETTFSAFTCYVKHDDRFMTYGEYSARYQRRLEVEVEVK